MSIVLSKIISRQCDQKEKGIARHTFVNTKSLPTGCYKREAGHRYQGERETMEEGGREDAACVRSLEVFSKEIDLGQRGTSGTRVGVVI